MSVFIIIMQQNIIHYRYRYRYRYQYNLIIIIIIMTPTLSSTIAIVKLICNIALTSARSPVGANMAFLRCKYGADFDTSVHTLLNCINVYHELDESL